MKQKIYILGIINLLLVFAGALMKVNHWAGAGIALTVGVLMLVFLFLPLALINNYRTEGSWKNPLLHIVVYLTGLIVFGSMLFKIQHWLAAGTILLIGLSFPYVVFLPVYLTVTSKIKNYSIYNTVFVLFLLVYMSVFSVLLGLTISTRKLDQSQILTTNYQYTASFVKEYMIQFSDTGFTDNHQGILNASDQLLATINYCQEELNEQIKVRANSELFRAHNIRALDSKSLANQVMLDIDNNEPALQLENDIRNFIRVLGEIPNGGSLANTASDVLLISRDEAIRDTWRQNVFSNEYLGWVLVYLESMETNVLLLKNQAMMLM